MKPLSVALAVAGWGLYLTSFWLPAVTAGCCERFPGFYAAIWASLAAFGAVRDVRLLVDPMFGAMPVLLVSTNAPMLLSPLGLSGESRRRLRARLLIGMLAAVAVQILGYLWVLDLSGRQDYFFRPSGVDVGYVVWTASFAVVGLALLIRQRGATADRSGPATGRPRGPDAPGPGAVAPPPDARGQRASAAGGAGTPPRPENAPMLHQVRRPRRRGAAHARFGGTLAATARSAVLALLLAPGPLALRVGPAEAGTRAYVFAESREVALLDTDADTLEARRLRLPFEARDPYGRDVTRPVPLATVDGMLFVAYFPEPVDSYGTVRLAAVDLETLALRAAFDVQSLRMSAYATEVTTPAVHVPAGGAHVYLEVVAGIHITPDRDALPRRRTVRLDRRTLVPTAEQPQLPAGLRGKRLVPSADGRHLFGWNPWDPRLVDIFDAATLEHLGGRDVAFEHLGPLTGRGKIADLRNDRVLLVEDRTPRGDDPTRYYRFETWKEFGGDPGRYALFTVHLRDGSRTPTIDTKGFGQAWLTPGADRIVFDEEGLFVEPESSDPLYRRVGAMGRLHVYDVATGRKLGQVGYREPPAPEKRYEQRVYATTRLAGFTPTGDKVYLYVRPSGGRYPREQLVAVSLTSLSVIRTWELSGVRHRPLVFLPPTGPDRDE